MPRWLIFWPDEWSGPAHNATTGLMAGTRRVVLWIRSSAKLQRSPLQLMIYLPLFFRLFEALSPSLATQTKWWTCPWVTGWSLAWEGLTIMGWATVPDSLFLCDVALQLPLSLSKTSCTGQLRCQPKGCCWGHRGHSHLNSEALGKKIGDAVQSDEFAGSAYEGSKGLSEPVAWIPRK